MLATPETMYITMDGSVLFTPRRSHHDGVYCTVLYCIVLYCTNNNTSYDLDDDQYLPDDSAEATDLEKVRSRYNTVSYNAIPYNTAPSVWA